MQSFVKRTLSVGLLAFMMALLALPATTFADDSDDGTASVAITSDGEFEVEASNIAFDGVQLGDGVDQTVAKSASWNFRDKTNAGDGWHVILSATDFDGVDHNGDAVSIDNDNLSVACNDANITTNDGSTDAPECQATTAEALDGNVTLLSAGDNGPGMGDYSAQMDFSLFLDGYTTVKSPSGYSSTLTTTMIVGP